MIFKGVFLAFIKLTYSYFFLCEYEEYGLITALEKYPKSLS